MPRERASEWGAASPGRSAESIRDAPRNALEAAENRDARSLVIPALGCGIAGFDLREGARIVCEQVAEFEPETLEDVRFVAYADDEYEAVRTVADEVRES